MYRNRCFVLFLFCLRNHQRKREVQFNEGVYNSDIWRQKFRDSPYYLEFENGLEMFVYSSVANVLKISF